VRHGDAARATRPGAAPTRAGTRWSAIAFGLTLAGSLELGDVVASAAADGPDTSLDRVPRNELTRAWRAARPEPLFERRLADGRVALSIARDDRLGFRVWAPEHGCYLVAPDGRRVRGAPPAARSRRWERLVLAQALPLAALMQGREVFHASAVELCGRAVAFLGPSGAGKTTVAAFLIARGARLVTDDVLAVDVAGETVWGHRGGAIVRVDPSALRRLDAGARRSLGSVDRRGVGKWHIRPQPAAHRLPLAAAYILDRRGRGDDVVITPQHPVDPALVLGSAFLSYITDADRLRRRLDAAAAVAAGVPVFRLTSGSEAGPSAVASAVHAHAHAALGG